MKRLGEFLLFCLLVSCSCSYCGWAQSNAGLPSEIENEHILGINKQPYHATLMPYATRAQAVAAVRKASPFARLLNGNWKFFWVPRPEQRPVDFYKPGYDVSAWKEIPVPSNMEIQGYGTPYYRNNGYTFRKDWPHVMSEPPREWTAYKERDPVGSYRRDFDVPTDWQGRRVMLTFSGVDSAFFVWVNGQKVGYSTNSRNPAEFDITEFVHSGSGNVLAVEVYRYSSGSFLEDQDMWRLSGIFRDVFLWSAPSVHIRDFSVVPELDADYRDAKLQVTAKVKNFSDRPAPARNLAIELAAPDGRTVPGVEKSVPVPALQPGEEVAVAATLNVAAPAKWTAETPNLYTTVLALSDAKGPEYISTRTGFRKIEIKNAAFLINGVPVKLKGANRHENWPDTGHYVSEERMIRDLELLKQVNANHVRTSHYTNDPRWYELADQYGIYLVAEANVECHGYYGILDREPLVEPGIIDRNIANVENLKNHPSVVIWSLGNECGGGSSFRSALKTVKQLDATRPVQYEPFGGGPDLPTDIESHMYTNVTDLEAAAKDPNRTKPFYMCEYAHAMNNSMGSVGEYNDLFDKYPKLMGGAIWEWEDQGIWNRRDPQHPYLAYGGGFGEVPNDHYFIHKGVVFSDRSLKPHYPELKRVYQWISFDPVDLANGSIRIRNRYAFTNLKKFAASWNITEDGVAVAQGKLPPLDLAPGAETSIQVPVSRFTPKPGREYFLNLAFNLAQPEIWAPAGYAIANAQFELPVHLPAPSAAQAAALHLDQGNGIRISGDHFAIAFDQATGAISHMQHDGVEMLAPNGGPRLYLWRAPHRNDDEWASESWERYGINRLRVGESHLSAEQLGPSEIRVTANVHYLGSGGWSAQFTSVYLVRGDGTIAVSNQFEPIGEKIPLARIGVRLKLGTQWNRFTYLGRGPMENYSDRDRGSDVGLYSSTVAEQLTPYAKPMEAGNHQDVRWAALSGDAVPSLLAKADGLMQVSALPYTDEQLDVPEYSIDLPPSDATTLILSTKTLGVGSNSCGPRPLPQYVVWSEPASFGYVLRLLAPGDHGFEAASLAASAASQH